MEVNWRILYRGTLDSCNYDCHYCPFAKKKNTRQELEYDKACLLKFSDWVQSRKENISILLTPWGEGLIRKYYQETMVKLSHSTQVKKIAIQTNLSCSIEWMDAVNKETFALWTTYHPEEIEYAKFATKINTLIEKNIRFSIGVVGKKEYFPYIERLKKDFPDQAIWINAYKDEDHYYTDNEIEKLKALDRLFTINLKDHHSLGESCAAGETSFSVNHLGDVFPCHFIKNKLGNIYEEDISNALKPSHCSRKKCDCYIGYINLKKLNLDLEFGDQILERIPLKNK